MKWRILVYLAGDNDLDEPGIGGVADSMWLLESEGPSENVEVFLQIDGLSGDGSIGMAGTRRYLLKKAERSRGDWTMESILVADLGELNTGDPAVFREFLLWGLADSTADRHVLVLWNHGSGILDIIEKAGVALPQTVKSNPSELAELSRFFFKSTIVRSMVESGGLRDIGAKAIGYDVTSEGDALETRELKDTLDSSLRTVNGTRRAKGLRPVEFFDLLVFDACFMSSIELIFELRSLATIVIASQAPLPKQGLPYDFFLKSLKADPSAEPRRVADKWIEDFDRSYSTRNYYVRNEMTLSAIETKSMQRFAEAIEISIRHVLERVAEDKSSQWLLRGYADDVAKNCPRFFQGGQYIDALIFFANASRGAQSGGTLIKQLFDGAEPLFGNMVEAGTQAIVRSAARKVLPHGAVDEQFRVTGLTLLFPVSALPGDVIRKYKDIEFSKSPYGAWCAFLSTVKGLN